MPPNPQPKPQPKGKGLGGIPTWGWIAAIGAGLVIGYILLKKSPGTSATSTDQSSGSPIPLGTQAGSGGGGITVVPPSPLQGTPGNQAPGDISVPPFEPANNATPATGNNQNPMATPTGDILNTVAASSPFGSYTPLTDTSTFVTGGILGTPVGGGYGNIHTGTPYVPPGGIVGSILEANIPNNTTVPANIPGTGIGPTTPAGSNVIGHGFV